MRELVIENIIKGFASGLDELNIHYTSDTQEARKMCEFVRMTDNKYGEKFKAREKYLHEDGGLARFTELLETLSDKELLDCLNGQACQSYR